MPRRTITRAMARGARLLALLPLLMGSQAFAASNITAGCAGGNATSMCPTASISPDGCSSAHCQPCGQNGAAGSCTAQCDIFDTCSGHGRCRGSTGECECFPCFRGADCSIPNSCTGHGECQSNTTGACLCDQGWRGSLCHLAEFDPCQDECDMFVDCSGHGRCTEGPSALGKCECYPGFAGADCSIPAQPGCVYDCLPSCGQDSFSHDCVEECDMFVTCSGHGRCRGSTGGCVCYPGWGGVACDTQDCPLGFARNCSGDHCWGEPGCDAASWCDAPCHPVCGDGILVTAEECDDGNELSYDGCSSSCTVECGWYCDEIGCRGICGDGMRKGNEQCDDANFFSGDGCSRWCTVETGYACSGALGPVCRFRFPSSKETCALLKGSMRIA
jgi:cysteine-rich repeat protein